MASKDLKSKLRQNTRKVSVDPEPSISNTTEAEKKKKVGRPKVKTEECKTINIAIPISTLEKMQVAKVLYRDNLTLYVNTVIEKDLKENFERYKMFADIQEESLNN